MKIVIKFNKKLSKWMVLLDNNLIFSYFYINRNNKSYGLIFKSYLYLLKILRQFGLKKSIKNFKQY